MNINFDYPQKLYSSCQGPVFSCLCDGRTGHEERGIPLQDATRRLRDGDQRSRKSDTIPWQNIRISFTKVRIPAARKSLANWEALKVCLLVENVVSVVGSSPNTVIQSCAYYGLQTVYIARSNNCTQRRIDKVDALPCGCKTEFGLQRGNYTS